MKITLLLCCFLMLMSFSAFSQPKFNTQIIDSNIAIGYGLALGDVDGDKKVIKFHKVLRVTKENIDSLY